MKKNLDIVPGTKLEDAYMLLVQNMIEKHDIFWAEFNGQPIFSNDSIDDVYKRIFKKPYLEIQNEISLDNDRYLKKNMITEAAENEFFNCSKQFIKPEKWEEWKFYILRKDAGKYSFEYGNQLIHLAIMIEYDKHNDELISPASLNKYPKKFYSELASDAVNFLKSGEEVSKYILDNFIKE